MRIQQVRLRLESLLKHMIEMTILMLQPKPMKNYLDLIREILELLLKFLKSILKIKIMVLLLTGQTVL